MRMQDSGSPHTEFKVIPGDRQRSLRKDGLSIVSTPAEDRPFSVEARVYEEDTCLIMSTRQVKMAPDIHPIRLLDNLEKFEPRPVGSIVVQKGQPLKLMAVVYDVSQTPVCRGEWVAGALAAIFRETAERCLTSLELPLLGVKHGRLSVKRFARLLADALDAADPAHLRRIWLPAAIPDNIHLIKEIERLVGQG